MDIAFVLDLPEKAFLVALFAGQRLPSAKYKTRSRKAAGLVRFIGGESCSRQADERRIISDKDSKNNGLRKRYYFTSFA
jgi:hypothetical protein